MTYIEATDKILNLLAIEERNKDAADIVIPDNIEEIMNSVHILATEMSKA